MSTPDPYKPGAFFLTTIGGRTGFWVGVGQALTGHPSRWTHAGIIGYEGTTWEAAPGGVRTGTLAELRSKPHLVCDAPVQEAVDRLVLPMVLGARERAERRLRAQVVVKASLLWGTPYSFLDYLALALHHLEVQLTGRPAGGRWALTRWVRRRVESSGHLICSAYVDRVMFRAGIRLYDDGRMHGDVMPTHLAAYADERGSVTYSGGA